MTSVLDHAPEAVKHAAKIAEYFKTQPQAIETISDKPSEDVVAWGEKNFYIPSDSGKPRLIRFMPHQKVIMKLFFDPVIARKLGCEPNFQTLVYSTVKKSGKTAIAALLARWITETWGHHAEVYALANDLEQARGRIYAAALASIELDPRYDLSAKGIPGLWRIIERAATYIPTHSTLKAVSSDYKGEAGSNPVATLWSELWGYSSELSERLWDELTPVPTRPRSIRYIETYAGYEGESGILNALEDRLKDKENGSKRLNIEDLQELGLEWPWPDEYELPFYYHPASRTMAYWDEGEIARRMPWQTPAYYAAQEADLRPTAFRRLHLNFRVSSVDEFIPIEWWDRLKEDLRNINHDEPVVLGADASVSGDCTAVSIITRDYRPNMEKNLLHRGGHIWTPKSGEPLDYSKTLEPYLRVLCTGHNHSLDEECDATGNHLHSPGVGQCPRSRPLNVVALVYDPYQLHDMMTRFRNEGVAWCKPFSQQSDRSIADKALYDAIRNRTIHHMGDPDLRDHIRGCSAKIPTGDNSRLRIIKKATKSKIDYAVATSMAAHECLRLNLT